jgi:hypothetical protein
MHAIEATDALSFVVGKLVSERLALRVFAPGASQRAPFEKDNGPDAGAIVGRKTLNIEYHVF